MPNPMIILFFFIIMFYYFVFYSYCSYIFFLLFLFFLLVNVCYCQYRCFVFAACFVIVSLFFSVFFFIIQKKKIQLSSPRVIKEHYPGNVLLDRITTSDRTFYLQPPDFFVYVGHLLSVIMSFFFL